MLKALYLLKNTISNFRKTKYYKLFLTIKIIRNSNYDTLVSQVIFSLLRMLLLFSPEVDTTHFWVYSYMINLMHKRFDYVVRSQG